MREAYATVSLAIRHLVSGEGDEVERLKNQAVLRSVLQRRPVSRGFALSALARRLHEGAAGGEQPGPQGSEKSAGTSTGAPPGAAAPHAGIRLALEVVLESSYHPSTPQTVAPVLDALGEDSLEALLQAAGGTTPLLPWTARLCLLHASLVGGNAGSRRWRSLSTVADSACSLALQDVATKGGSSGTTGNGKGPARLPPAKGASAREADMDGPFNTAFMAQVCEELVKIGATRVELSSPGNGFLHDFSGLSPSVGRGGSYPSRSADPLPGVHASGSFRLKLQALRDALLSTCGGEGNAEEPPMPMRMGMVGDVEPEDLEVHPEAVRRALERGRCGEAFIVAVKAALEANLTSTAGSEATVQAAPSGGSRRSAVKLKPALDACLFGVGISGGRGLLDAVETKHVDVGSIARSSPAAAVASAGATRTSGARSPPPNTRRAFALMRGLVEEGVRIRDLLLVLVGMHHERELRSSLAGPVGSLECKSASSWRTGAQAVAAVHSSCDFRGRMLVAVLGTFVEWLADTPWVWGATEGMEGEDWEGDFAAAALAIPVAFPAPLDDPGTGVCAEAPLVEQIQTNARVPRQCGQGISTAADPARNSLGEPGSADAADVLDRLVGGVAAAMEHADADKVGWVDVLRHLTAANTASTTSLKAYALACVEKSASLGGQAPFRVAGKRRFSQVGGKELWGLLEGACQLDRNTLAIEGTTLSVLVRTAAAAVTASRRISQSCMISPGLLGSGPVRVVIDMVGAAKGNATESCVLSGLLETGGEEGPALAADMFAAFIAAETATSESASRSRAVAWLSGALSASSPPARDAPADINSVIASTTLARVLIGRVPYEAKPVLLAVEEAAERGAACARRSGKRKHQSRTRIRDSSDGDDGGGASSPLATLLKVARAAWESHLLPLSVPASLSAPTTKPGEGGERSEDAGALPVGGGSPGKPTEKHGDGAQADESAAVTAGLLLDSFVQSPAAVRRSIRDAMQERGSNNELRIVLRALRLALCTTPATLGSTAGSRTAESDPLGSEKASPLSAGLGARKAPACLLVGGLVESGVPGWEETKAAMIPPPLQLLAAAEGQSDEEAAEDPARCDGFRQPLTALRLEMWLRPLLRDAATPGFDPGVDIEISFPDVFRTARTLARAIARHASYLIAHGGRGTTSPLADSCYSQSTARGFGNFDFPRPTSYVAYGGGAPSGDTSRQQEVEADGQLQAPRRALAGRLQQSPAAEAVVSWVSSIVKTARQFERWLPWQPFADELRELLSARQDFAPQQAGGGAGATAERKILAAEAALFAVCELLVAWKETGQEVVAEVFRPALCSKALDAAGAPVPTDAPPPIWLEVFRCLVNESKGNLSDWMTSTAEGRAYQGPLSVAAAAAVWIGGDGAGGGRSGKRSSRDAWMRWYEAELRPLVPPADADFGNWLILSNVAGKSSSRGVQVRTGVGGAAPPTVVQPKEWEKWGRSPLQAAWKIPAGWAAAAAAAAAAATDEEGSAGTAAGVALPPHVVILPPFASWLRAVLKGGPGCPQGVLEAYLRRMAREVFLPCQFGGASSEMARQWLAVLIEAEAAAERKRKKATGAAVETGRSSGNEDARAASARQPAVKAFFREELLRFGSGEAAAAAAVGGPLTWLWPLEAVVSACGKTGSFGGGLLARRRRRNSPGGEGRLPKHAAVPPTLIVLDGPPSALARVLCTVPHDLLCGSRRFDRGGGQPPPAPATLCAFAGRVVDLTARALATPPCRHWSVARRLLLGLGLLYHALATPSGSAKNVGSQRSPSDATARVRGVESSGLSARARGEDTEAQAAAQAAVLCAIESLVGIALGFGSSTGPGRVDGGSARAEGKHRGAPALLSSACLSLQPLEVGTCVGADNLAEALRGAGAWRAAAAFFGRKKDLHAAPSMQEPSMAQTAPVAPSSPPPPPPPPLSPQADLPRQCHLHPSPGAIPAMEVDQPVGGGQANGQSTAGPPVEGGVDGEPPCSSGGDELRVGAPHAPSWGVPSVSNKKARLSAVSAEGTPPPYSPRRVLPARSSKRLHSSS